MKTFTPLLFLASLGAGGITIIPFAYLQYVHPHGKGLITLQEILTNGLVFPLWTYIIMGIVMVVFTLIHIGLTVIFSTQLIDFARTDDARLLWNDPLKNTVFLAPFISFIMTMNVVIGPIRFFIPTLAENLQVVMPYAFYFWLAILFALLYTSIALLKISFTKGFDVDKIHFGWLLHPFALAMATVTGMGIAAMATNANIAHSAAFFSLVSGTMGIFLFLVKVVALFKRHFRGEGMPEKQFLPSFLIVIPILTLYAISLFRFGHYLAHHAGATISDAYYLVVTTGLFAFETWYLLFGISLLFTYFKTSYREREYYPTLWGLICPFVAYAVLASFVFASFVPTHMFTVLVVLSEATAIVLFGDLLKRHILYVKQSRDIDCIG